jgi:peptidoglycan/xylan/chitin deacetylase (PgdA/CDA1 family)
MMIPILMYHEITDDPPHPYAISRTQFEDQLKYLSAHRYRSIVIDDQLFRLEKGGLKADPRSVVITFDDAQVSNYTQAMPLLQKYGFRATFFVPTVFIDQGQRNLMKKQLIEMDREGMVIQSHSHSHPFLNDLHREGIYSELAISKKILEEVIQKNVTIMSCPGGRYSKNVIDIAKEIGYRGVCISEPGTTRLDFGLPVLGRFLITQKTNLRRFESICSLDPMFIKRIEAEHYLKNAVKRMIGNKLYHRLWKALQG